MAIKDFQAKRIRSSILITSGGISDSHPHLGMMIYSSSVAEDFDGTRKAGMLEDDSVGGGHKVGQDVYLFISGSATRAGPPEDRDQVTLFGGDMVVSGTLWAERMVVEVDEVAGGNQWVTGSLTVLSDDNINVATHVIGASAVNSNVVVIDSDNTADDSALRVRSNTTPDNCDDADTIFLVQGDGKVELADGIYHYGDEDTKINFETNKITMYAGGDTRFSLVDGASVGNVNLNIAANENYVISNPYGLDVDFYMPSTNAQRSLITGIAQSGKPQVFILSGGLGATADAGGEAGSLDGKGSDVAFFVSGSVGTKDENNTWGTSIFGGDLQISGTMYTNGLAVTGDVLQLTASMVDVGWDPATAGTATGPILRMTSHHDVVTDGDTLGTMEFFGIDAEGSSAGTGAKIIAQAAGAWSGNNDYPTELQFWTCYDVGGGLAQRLVIDKDGNVGIGVADPDTTLEVLSTTAQLKLSGDSGTGTVFHVNDTSGTLKITPAGGNVNAIMLDASAIDLGLGTTADTTLEFLGDTNNLEIVYDESEKTLAFDGTDLFIDADAARVGINTNSPDYTLDVAGDIGVDEYIYHNGDNNTKIRFQDDKIDLHAGGTGTSGAAIQIRGKVDGGVGDPIIVLNYTVDGASSKDVDFAVLAEDGAMDGSQQHVVVGKSLIHGIAESGNEQVLILSGGGADPGSTADDDLNYPTYPDVAFWISGSVGNKGSQTLRGTSVFGGDTFISGAFYPEGGIVAGPASSGGTGKWTQALKITGSIVDIKRNPGENNVPPGDSSVPAILRLSGEGTAGLSGEALGILEFWGAQNSGSGVVGEIVGAKIIARGGAGWAANDGPTNLEFWTCPDGSATLAKRLTIDYKGQFTIPHGSVTSGAVISVSADTLTTGNILNLESNSPDAGVRSLVKITNSHASAVNLYCLEIVNDAPTAAGRGTVKIENTGDTEEPLLELWNSHTSADNPAVLSLVKYAQNDSVGWDIGRIDFDSTDPSRRTFASILVESSDDKDASSSYANWGVMRFKLGNSAGNLNEIFTLGDKKLIDPTYHVVVNEEGVACNFRVETEGKTHALFISGGNSDTVLILSGGATTDPVYGHAHSWTDTNFFVSGSIGLKGSATHAGTAVFGGDAVVSGSLAIGENRYIHTDGNTSTNWQFLDGHVKASAGGWQWLSASNTGGGTPNYQVHIGLPNPAQRTGGTSQVLILSGGGELSTDESRGRDVGLYVSGTIGAVYSGSLAPSVATRGAAVFGGDAFISGALYMDELTEAVGTVGDDSIALYAKADGSNTKLFFKYGNTEAQLQTGGGLHWNDAGDIISPADGAAESVGIGAASSNSPGAYDIYLGSDGSAVFNEQGASVDFRVEGATSANALFVKGSNNRVGIGTASPDTLLTVAGDIHLHDASNDAVIFLTQGNTVASPTHNRIIRNTAAGLFQIRDQIDSRIDLTIDGDGNIGIGATDPDEKLEVAGRIHISSEVAAPSAPSAGDGGILYTKTDGLPYWISDDQAEVALTSGGGGGTLGAAEDGSYTDGLFTDFATDTTIGTAIDRINEVLKGLAPSAAPSLDDMTCADTGQGAKLSFGAASGITGYADALSSDLTANNLSSVNINGTFSVTSDTNDLRRACFAGATVINGTLNDDVSADSPNYVANALGNGDQGTLRIYANHNSTMKHSVDLSSFGSGNSFNGNGTGFTLSAVTDGHFADGSAFPTFKHRTGTWTVAVADQVAGWNYVRVEHVIGGTTTTTNYVEWVNDATGAGVAMGSSGATLDTLSMTGTKNLSGVKYHTGGTAAYDITITNAYRNVYSTSPITFGGLNTSVPSVNIPDINYGGGEDETKSIVLANLTVTISASSILNGSISVNTSVPHPLKSNISGGGNTSLSGILLDNLSDTSSTTSETFRGESYRLVAGSYANQAAVTSGGNAWVSTTSLTGVDGLMFYNSRLYTPVQGAASGDFSSVANGPGSNVDYSGITSGTRTFYRKFQNTSGGSKTGFDLTINGTTTSTIVAHGTAFSTTNLKVYVKLPETGGGMATGFMDPAVAFSTGQVSDGDGCLVGSFDSTLNATNEVTFGTQSVADDEWVVVIIKADATYTGYLSALSVSWS